MSETVALGQLHVDRVDRVRALDAIEALVRRGAGGRVYTPNLDHVRLASESPAFRDVYRRASLALADGMPLVWASRLFGQPLPERVTGSDLIEPLCERAARHGWRVLLLGGAPGSAEAAAERLTARYHVNIVACLVPQVDIDSVVGDAPLIDTIVRLQPHLVFVSLGSPKQELWIDRVAQAVQPSVLLGIGAGLDFLAGQVQRAPAWVGRMGLEWLFRLMQEPGRLWRRYLIAGPKGLWYLLSGPRAETALPLTPRAPTNGH